MEEMGAERAEAMGRILDALRQYSEHSERIIDLMGSRRGLHRTDLRTLSLLTQRDRAGAVTTPSDITRHLGLSSASTTALVDRLVRQGHARRERSEHDRRSVRVLATESATKEGRELFLPIAKGTWAALEPFTDEELATAERVLRAATDALLHLEDDWREGR